MEVAEIVSFLWRLLSPAYSTVYSIYSFCHKMFALLGIVVIFNFKCLQLSDSVKKTIHSLSAGLQSKADVLNETSKQLLASCMD